MTRHLAANGFTFLILGLIVALGLINWGQREYAGPGPLAEPLVFEVESGTNWARVTEKLKEQGAISNGFVFRVGLNYADREEDLKAGVFEIPAGASMAAIAEQLTKGGGAATRYQATFRVRADGVTPRLVDRLGDGAVEGEDADILARIEELVGQSASLELRVAVPEGLTTWQVVQGLNAIPYLDGEIAEIPAEGTLAPNTFAFRRGSSRAELIAQMEAQQAQILAAAWEARDPEVPLQSPEELLILASIIEKETGIPTERGQVASVFRNRLEQGMQLQTDPTVIYGITLGREILGRGLRRSELNRPTPYNTYVIPGLPPTPIANPGRASIEAAAKPEQTDFLFFVADGTGGHAFARTLAEHNENVARWRRIEAEQAPSGQ